MGFDGVHGVSGGLKRYLGVLRVLRGSHGDSGDFQVVSGALHTIETR